MDYFLGIDLGSSSVKVCIFDADNGKTVASAYAPKNEAPILAAYAGWAEQNPSDWWEYLKSALYETLSDNSISGKDIKAIGITYQMHGLVLVDKYQQVLRPSIIWCDSRAVPNGARALKNLGESYCLHHLLNAPGNFTASKLSWVRENEPKVFELISKFMLPGDYIAMMMTGNVNTTLSGLSEGIIWDFKEDKISDHLLAEYGIPSDLIADMVPTFGEQGRLTEKAAKQLGLVPNIPICYRAGDQPNNALSLNVLNPGEVAATAGTSGVVYGISEKVCTDEKSRINIFAHVNYQPSKKRLGVMHCTNGVGIQNAWMKKMIAPDKSYEQFNEMASTVPAGADGVSVLPFGNGAERILENRQLCASIHGLNFNKHDASVLARAAQEGVAFSFKYGMDVMKTIGMNTDIIRAGYANMFLSSVFRETLATVSNAVIELYDSNGATGAAIGAAIGYGYYSSFEEAFFTLKKIDTVVPNLAQQAAIIDAYSRWKNILSKE